MLATKPAAPTGMPVGVGAMADPFAGPAPAGAPMAQQVYPAPGGVPTTVPDDDFVMGVPKGPPKWLVPAIIGTLAVIVGVVGAVVFLK